MVLLTAAGGWVGFQRLADSLQPPGCEVRASGASHDWAPDQASNTAVITAIALRRSLPPRAATIAIATALQESKVRNVAYGDRDSLGLFQQRPSQGWGTAEQILNPEYSSGKFYDALVKVPDWQTSDIAAVAQSVQRSADGTAYARHEAKARATASVLAGFSPGGIGCRLDPPAAVASGEAVAAFLQADHGVTPTIEGNRVSITVPTPEQAWAIGSWAVARAVDTGATSVTVEGRQWVRGRGKAALGWHDAAPPAGPHTVVIGVG